MQSPTQVEVSRANARVANFVRHYGHDDPRTVAMRNEYHHAKAIHLASLLREHFTALDTDQRAHVLTAIQGDDR